jgi:hypothetical protein
MADKKPIALIWLFPSQGTMVTNLLTHKPPKNNPPPVEPGTVLRCGGMLGEALEDRFLDGIPLGVESVAVRCTYSLSRFPDLDKAKTNVWSMSTSQALSGQLLEEAQRAPERFLRKFMQLEKQLLEQEAEKRKQEAEAQQPKPKKRPPGKRRSK